MVGELYTASAQRRAGSTRKTLREPWPGGVKLRKSGYLIRERHYLRLANPRRMATGKDTVHGKGSNLVDVGGSESGYLSA